MSYDDWKTRSPDDEAPQIFVDCSECAGEGTIDVWEGVSRWSIDPPCAHPITCPACHGTLGFICDAPGAAASYDPRDDEE